MILPNHVTFDLNCFGSLEFCWSTSESCPIDGLGVPCLCAARFYGIVFDPIR